MPVIRVKNLIEGHVTEADYYTAEGQLLIAKGEVITDNHLRLLQRRNIFEIHLHLHEGDEPDPPGGESDRASDSYDEHEAMQRWRVGECVDEYEQLLRNRALKGLDRALQLDRIDDRPIGKSLKSAMKQSPSCHRPEEYKKRIARIYSESLDTVKLLMHRLVNGACMDPGALRGMVERFIEPFINDRNILLAISCQKVDRTDPIYNHALNVCLLAMNIAATANYSQEQIIHIGMGSLLHDLGMLLIPRSIRFKEGRLDNEEWYEVRKHPLFGIQIIDRMMRLPDAVKYITYQIHERENGKGYPKQRSGRLIHNFAKIAMVADVFEAVSSPRPYRPAFAPFKGIEMLIKMAKEGLLNETFVTAMLKTASLFPVGSLVELNDGRVGQVVAPNEFHLARPVISIITESGGRKLGKSDIYTVDLATDPSLQVAKSLPFDPSIEDVMYGF